MTQGVLPFKLEEEKKDVSCSSFSGLSVYLDLFSKINLKRVVDHHLPAKKNKQGWSDYHFLSSLLLLNLSGGDCVDDIQYLEKDAGLSRLLKNLEVSCGWDKNRVKSNRQRNNNSQRAFPSPSAIFRYLDLFYDKSEEVRREEFLDSHSCKKERGKAKWGKSFIPAGNSYLDGLRSINKEILNFFQLNHKTSKATLDMDATIIESSKEQALPTYKKICGYQPLNVWWNEQQVVLHTEFRDGNVGAGFENKRVLEEALDNLPVDVEKVYLRADTASYQYALLDYCEKGEHKRFGRIEFAIGCDVTREFRDEVKKLSAEDWRPFYVKVGNQSKHCGDWAEVPFVSNATSRSKNSPDYRYIAIREALLEQPLKGMEDIASYTFPTVDISNTRYKLYGLVSNMDWSGEELINWYRKRCGKSEQVHSEMKNGYCGGQLPSAKFGANAAWWWIMIMALNLTSILKSLALDSSWSKLRIKRIRFSLIRVAGRVIKKGRETLIRLSKGHPAFKVLLEARFRIQALFSLPCLMPG